MDDEFYTKLKSISAKDVLTDQRPATSRLRSSRGGRLFTAAAAAQSLDTQKVAKVNQPTEDSGPMQTLSELFSKQPTASPQVKRNGDAKVEYAETRRKSIKPKVDGEANSGSFTRTARFGTATGSRGEKAAVTSNFIVEEESPMYIPDLNDMHTDEINQTIATAPEIEAEKITSLKELDADLARLNTFSVVRGVDMRKLARFMLPENKLALYADQSEDMRSTTYEQLYGELLPLINGKSLISFDFSSRQEQQRHLEGFSSFLFGAENISTVGLSGKDGKKRKVDPRLLQKVKDYAYTSAEQLTNKHQHEEYTGTSMASLDDILRRAREKHDQKIKGTGNNDKKSNKASRPK